MQYDIFHDDDGVIDDQAYGGRQAAQRHQIKALTQPAQSDERNGNCRGDHQASH